MSKNAIQMEKNARDLIQNSASCHRQPIWVISILVVGGLIGPVGGIVDFVKHLKTENGILDWAALIVLLAMIYFAFTALIISAKTVCFDGLGIQIKQIFGPTAFDWTEIYGSKTTWFGAEIIASSGYKIRILEGDEFIIKIITAQKIWENRFVEEE